MFGSEPWLNNMYTVVHHRPLICSCISRAVGHMTYGSTYREQIVDKLRKAAEHCDCLQCFFLIHSMGGGKMQLHLRCIEILRSFTSFDLSSQHHQHQKIFLW